MLAKLSFVYTVFCLRFEPITEDVSLGRKLLHVEFYAFNNCTSLYPCPVLESNLAEDVDSDHDYEQVDDLMTMIEKAQQSANFY